MNWIKKIKYLGQRIKVNFKKKFPTKEEVENSDWTSCCTGPILKKDLEDNFWVCNACGKHHRINCLQRFNIFFGKENYEIIKTPIPGDENPLKWEDVKPYKNRLADAKKKTGQDCAIMVAKGKINNIEVIAAASNFEFLGGSVSIAESEAIVYAVQNAIDNKIPFVNFCSGGGMRMMASAVSLTAGMGKTTIAINELKKSKLPYLSLIHI